MTQDQVEDLIKDIRSSGYELTSYSSSLLQTVETYGQCSPSQLDYLINLHGVLCTMNKDWIYPKQKTNFRAEHSNATTLKSSDSLDALVPKGKYKGKPIREILAADPSYIWWAYTKQIVELPKDIADKLGKVFKR